MRLSLIIPTVNRPKELQRLLDSFIAQTALPDEIIVVEQGKMETRQLCQSYTTLPILFFHTERRSLPHARNVGVTHATGDVIGFLDDDIILTPTYVAAIKQFFRTYPQALGVQGVITDFEIGHIQKIGGNPFLYWCYNTFAKIFLLNNSSSRNSLQWSGRNRYASRITMVQPCQWLSGIGVYRRSVFDSYAFDEHLTGYAFGEDKLFSYPIYEEHPGSLFVDPAIRCQHKYADTGRPDEKSWVDMKITYTYYLWRKIFAKKGIWAWLAYWWANIGDMIVVFLSVLVRQHSWSFLWWHVRGYWRIVWTGTQIYNSMRNI